MFKFITKGERIVLSGDRSDDVKLAFLVSWIFAFLQEIVLFISLNHFRKVTAAFAMIF